MKQRTAEQKQAARRFVGLFLWSGIFAVVIAAECFVIASLLNMLKTPRVIEATVYQFIIPVVCGFAVLLSVIAPKLSRDLYDRYSKTSLAVIELEARKFAELHNQFAEERGIKDRLEVTK